MFFQYLLGGNPLNMQSKISSFLPHGRIERCFLEKGENVRTVRTRAFNSYIAEKVSIGRILPMFFCQFCVFYI